MGGGPSSEQRNAANAQANLSNEAAAAGREALDYTKAQQAKISPYATNLMNRGDQFYTDMAKGSPFWASREQNGLPYFNQLMDYSGGTVARSFAPAKADAMRRLSSTSFYGMPSGYKEAVMNDIGAQQARAYDANIVNNLAANEAAKQQAAQQNLQTKWNAVMAQNALRNQGAGLLTGQQQIAGPQGWYGQAMQGQNSIMNAPLASPGIGGFLGGLAGGAMSAIPF